jgi:hypothetical protein
MDVKKRRCLSNAKAQAILTEVNMSEVFHPYWKIFL